MFPDINKKSFSALKRFCDGKQFSKTKAFIQKYWDGEAISRMMFISSTPDIDTLVYWMVSPELNEKISTINNTTFN